MSVLVLVSSPLLLRMLIISFDAMCSIWLNLHMADTLVSSLEREIQRQAG